MPALAQPRAARCTARQPSSTAGKSSSRTMLGPSEGELSGSGWTVKSLADFPAVDEPVEDGNTFAANATLKAKYYGGNFGVPCVADDSGIEVDALDGAPGVYSARYAGEDCTYDDNNRKLIDALRDVPHERRGARFVCCAAFADLDGAVHLEEGEVRGHIVEAPRGTNGFGYDPVFVPEGESRTYAEMSAGEKNAMSHRGRAFSRMAEFLRTR